MPSLSAPDFGLLFDALSTPCLALAPDQTVAAANAAVGAWLGCAPAELLGRPADAVLPLLEDGASWATLLLAPPAAPATIGVRAADGAARALTLQAVRTNGHGGYVLAQAAPAPPAPEPPRPPESFRFLSEFIPQLVWTTDAQGRHDYFSPRWLDYTGHAGLAAPDPSWTAQLYPADQPAARHRWQQALSSGEPYRAELRLRSHDGRFRWFLVQALPLHDAHGRISQWLGTCTDVDDAKRVQQRLLAKDQQLQQILGQVPAYVATVFGTDHIVSFATPNFLELLGGRLRVGWPLAQSVPELAGQGLLALFDEAYRQGRPLQEQARPISWVNAQTQQRVQRYYDLTLQPLPGGQGQIQGVLFFAVDVTAQVQARQRHERLTATVRRRDEQVRAMTEALPLISFSQAPNGRLVYVSPQWSAFTGAPAKPPRGQDWRTFVHPDDYPTVAGSFVRARRDRQPWTSQLRLRAADGQYRWHLARSLPVFDEQQRLSRWYGTLTDVHEQQELAERLRHSEQQFRFLADTVPLFTWTATPAGQIDYANQRFLDYTGQTPGEVARGGWLALVHPDEQDLTRQRWAESMRTGQDCEVEHRVRGTDGLYRWFLVRATAMRDAEGRIVKWYGSSTDIHEQRALQDELRRSEEQFRFLADSLTNLIWIVEPDGTISHFNQRWVEYTGRSLEASLHWGWQDLVDPEDQERTLARFRQHMASGEPYENEDRVRRHDGQYRWHLHRALPLRDADGRILRWFGSSTDIDDYKRFQHELEARNAELLRINQDLDNFVYTASHDLRQPIDNMAGIFQELTRSARYDDPDAPALLTMFEHSLEQIYTTIKELAALVQTQKQSMLAAPEQVRLERLTQEVLHSIGEQVRTVGAVVETDFSQVPAVEFVRPNLQSVLYNLLSNAVKYHDPSRPPRIRVWTERDAAGRPVLTVQDNGLGIDLSRHGTELFQLFRRFHDHVPGSGTGLYLVQRLVQAHGGELLVESTPGVGTTFRVRLPKDSGTLAE
ncbi:PAS domain S-box protein [Hymenobacter gummosus]|uniref:histidine kinase n=1 Tax=Hymenobacter gummosus TaxID=1776032 RepID=A0A431U2Q3_9BACT|nr:PAS domain-containing protein [Hymenobacter gummosus]RTQ49658.1 PAS domain S-box protein [Hymenobacter gummosus]